MQKYNNILFFKYLQVLKLQKRLAKVTPQLLKNRPFIPYFMTKIPLQLQHNLLRFAPATHQQRTSNLKILFSLTLLHQPLQR